MSDDLSKKVFVSRLPPIYNSQNKSISVKASKINQKDFSSTSWTEYFDKCWDLKIERDSFRVYEAGESEPVLLFMHGGGFSALTWALLIKDIRRSVDCRCIAFDCRSHGDSITENDVDLDANTLVKDVERVVNGLFSGTDAMPPIILIGHSMGGAIATKAAYMKCIPSLLGLIVIDVVEGTALEALSFMQSFLKSRPTTFESVEKAIEYCHKSGQIKNLESAKVSVVGQLKKLASEELVFENRSAIFNNQSPIEEDLEEEEIDSSPISTAVDAVSKSIDQLARYGWRIDLTKTEPFWRGWFEGLSKMFLSAPAAKMLILAGVDRMDKELTVGQMQGKFQMTLLQNCGHAVHEDNPEKVSEVIVNFLKRNRFVT